MCLFGEIVSKSTSLCHNVSPTKNEHLSCQITGRVCIKAHGFSVPSSHLSYVASYAIYAHYYYFYYYYCTHDAERALSTCYLFVVSQSSLVCLRNFPVRRPFSLLSLLIVTAFLHKDRATTHFYCTQTPNSRARAWPLTNTRRF